MVTRCTSACASPSPFLPEHHNPPFGLTAIPTQPAYERSGGLHVADFRRHVRPAARWVGASNLLTTHTRVDAGTDQEGHHSQRYHRQRQDKSGTKPLERTCRQHQR